MNKKRILKSIGMFFIFITISAAFASAETASGKSKNNSTTIDNTKKEGEIIIYARGTSYHGDIETASGVPIKQILAIGLIPIAVDPDIIPLGSKITGRDKQGREIKGVAVDTGPDVTDRKAAKKMATLRGYPKDSREYKAPVFDIYARQDLTHYWSDFKVVPYRGKSFRFGMSPSERIAHLQHISKGG